MVKIKESLSQIQNSIYKSLSKLINRALPKAKIKIENRIIPIIRQALISSPEIQSLKGGILKLEFGLDNDPTDEIVEAIVRSLEIRVKKVDRKLNGGISILLQPDSFQNLLNLPSANQRIESGGSLPWLSWLLTLGDQVIIANYGVEFGPGGRSGGATMSKSYAPYKVNSSFSGTVDNNFITRAIARSSNQIKKAIKGAF